MVQAPVEYDWQKEYRAWRQSQPASPIGETMKTAAEWDRILPRAKMSDVLAATFEILDRPEIMSRYHDFLARRKNPNEKYYNVDDEECVWYEDRQYKRTTYMALDYCHWYRMKHDLRDNDIAYSGIPSLVYKIAEGSFDAKDIEAMRAHLRKVGNVFDESTSFGKRR